MLFLYLVLFCSAPPVAPVSLTLQGRIVSADDGRPVVGADIQLVNFKRLTQTDELGEFKFVHVTKGTYTLGIHCPGFSSLHPRVSLPSDVPFEFELRKEVHFQDEITVSAAPWAIDPLNTAQSVAILETETLALGATSLGESLEGVPGLSTIGTGDNLGTPVIRGVSENRIKILNDGIGVNHQQFSFRHSPNVEPGFSEKIEVLKGPQSVLYGSDAMGGVIHLIGKPLPIEFSDEHSLYGQVGLGFESNGERKSWNGELSGGVHAFGWRIGIVDRNGNDVETPEGTLENTDFSQTNFQGEAGWAGSWGSFTLKATHWENETGFYRPSDFRLNLADDLFSINYFKPSSIGEWRIQLAHQENNRQAYPTQLNGAPAVDLELVTQTGKIQWHHEPIQRDWGEWNGIVGLEWIDIENTPKALKKLLPEYTSQAGALVVFEELTVSRNGKRPLTLAIGLRADQHNLEVGVSPNGTAREEWSEDYSAISGSLGLVVPLSDNFSWTINLGRGWRPPNAFELFADGIHGGVSAIQLGNTELEEESNVNTETALKYKTDHLNGSVTIFHTNYDRYIHLYDTQEIRNGLPVFAYSQEDATIKGLEVDLSWGLSESLKISVVYSAIQTENRSSGNPLPQEPANNGHFALEWTPSVPNPWRGFFLQAKSVWVGPGYVSGPDEPFGTPTERYNLLNLKTGVRRRLAGPGQNRFLGFNLEVENLVDSTYSDFLYPYKAWADNPGRSIMGRITWQF